MTTIQATIQAMEITPEDRTNAVIAAREYIERGISSERARMCVVLRLSGIAVKDNVAAPTKPSMPHMTRRSMTARSHTVVLKLIAVMAHTPAPNEQLVEICQELYKNAWFLEEHANFTHHLYAALKDLVKRYGEDCYENLPAYTLSVIEALVPTVALAAPKATGGLYRALKHLQLKSWRMPSPVMVDFAALEYIQQLEAYAAYTRNPADYVTVMRAAIVYNTGWEYAWPAAYHLANTEPSVMADGAFRAHYACMKIRYIHCEYAAHH
jgi:hypothetical protein